ncbi:hypothetical protein B0H14DRAFT_3472008 [Mycena olivaceomarginata]|nr:hypothetical protein B0H14DRAFT_3472008 [Mycena olivaceomarginata]
MSSSSILAGQLRVAAYGIALFEYIFRGFLSEIATYPTASYLQSLPAEYRLYSKQKSLFQPSVACILFILVRYLGVAALVFGAVGFFYHGFSMEQCAKFYWLAPVFKLFLYLASQAILALRTYAVSRKSPLVLYTLILLFLVCSLIEFISTFWKRVPFQTDHKWAS